MIKSIAIGVFDGIHLAHLALIDKADAVVVIERNSAILTPGYIRAKYINKPIFFYHLEKIKELSPSKFVELLIENFPLLEEIIVGYDFSFGRDKSGNVGTLREFFKGKVTVMEAIKFEDIAIHSRIIKNLLREGAIEKANKLLGRTYQLCGDVVSGQGLGGKRFVPTLNVNIKEYLLPKEGVYATRTGINSIWYKSVTFIGHRVSTDGKYAVETHILDKEIDGVKGKIEINFEKFIRENRKFDDFDELKCQILDDIKIAREMSYE